MKIDKPIEKIYLREMEWYMKNRWWIWTVTAVYLAYRIFLSITF